MTARTGVLPPDGQRLELAGDVHLSGLAVADRGQPPPMIRTEKLTLDVDRSIASTAAPVRIDMGRNAVTARGLHADLKSDRVRLEADVSGRFER
jgi:LPS export ABC transporter protein LptC